MNVDVQLASTFEGIAMRRPVERRDRRNTYWIEGQAACNLAPLIPFPLTMHRKPLSSWSRSSTKRLFDCACIVLFMPLLIPACLAIALAVRLTSAGPVFFLQKRIGRYGRTFIIVKFRTMIHSSGFEHQLVTTESDKRFTPIGLLLRRWKLDELPQLMNVLWGDMSLVGPRPKVREHRIYILPCRPGITGAATITFADEEAVLARVSKHHLDLWYQSVVLPAKRRLDSEYMARATFLSDLKLIIRSVLRRWDSSAIDGLLSNGALETEERMDRSNASVPAVALSLRERPDWPQVRATELDAGTERSAVLATE